MKMRTLMLAAAVASLAGCQTATEPPQRTAEQQATYDRMLAGKTAGPAQRCLPSYRTNDMRVIDDDTILFKDGGTVYVNHPLGGCNQLGRGGYALVTRTFASTLCKGDISQVVDVSTGTFAGSCAMGDFVPYRG